MDYTIIGIDVATDKKKRYFSCAAFDENTLSLERVADGNDEDQLVTEASRTLKEGRKVLLALDAPLGWPQPLGKALTDHSAGDFLNHEPNDLFQRSTDRFIQKEIKKRPLDVGADRIARTAHAALKLLHQLGTELQHPIPLAWNANFDSLAAIEVYPAATLKAHDRSASGYKGKEGQKERALIFSWLETLIAVTPEQKNLLLSDDNALDSAICVLAGRDFLLGHCAAPTDHPLAKKEGWIWVRQKQGSI